MHMNEFIHVAEKSSLGIAINRIQNRSVERVYVNSAFKSMLGYQDAKDVTSIPLTETFKYQSDLNDYYLRPNDLRTSCRIRSDGNELWLTSYRETMEFDGAAYQVSWSIDMTDDHQNSASQRRIEKYTLLGELTENLAHEIAQPLTVITYGLFNIENRLKKLAGTDQTAINSLVERFGRISDQIDVLSSIIHRTRQFAKKYGTGIANLY